MSRKNSVLSGFVNAGVSSQMLWRITFGIGSPSLSSDEETNVPFLQGGCQHWGKNQQNPMGFSMGPVVSAASEPGGVAVDKIGL